MGATVLAATGSCGCWEADAVAGVGCRAGVGCTADGSGAVAVGGSQTRFTRSLRERMAAETINQNLQLM